jgi:hypothetical protein
MTIASTNADTILPKAAPDHDADGHVDDVALHRELFELGQEAHSFFSFSRVLQFLKRDAPRFSEGLRKSGSVPFAGAGAPR